MEKARARWRPIWPLQLSDMEKRTLLLDLNTRAPRLGGMFLQDLPYSRTLNALYKGESAEPEAVISLTGYLDLLPMVLEPDAVPLDAALFDFFETDHGALRVCHH